MLVEDVPAPEPQFGFGQLTSHLIKRIDAPRTGAFVLGLHGPWGCGKTTLLYSLRAQIVRDPNNLIVEFNAWKYHERETLARALIIQVLERLKTLADTEIESIRELERSLYASFTVKEEGPLHVNWTAAGTEALLLAMRLATANLLPGPLEQFGQWLNGLFNRKPAALDGKLSDVAKSVERTGKILRRDITERRVQQIVSIEQFLARFRELVAKLAAGRRVYVLIDDLDRCLPDAALEVFEATKLFLDAPECTYIMALDRDVIRRGLAIRYKGQSAGMVDPDEYIEKTITLSFDLPPLGTEDAVTLLENCLEGAPLDKSQLRRLVALLGTNPRRVKRFGRSVAMLFALAEGMHDRQAGAASPRRAEDRELFIKLALLSYRSSGVFALMVRDEGLPYRLQQLANHFEGDRKSKGEGPALQELQKSLVVENPVIQELGKDASFWRIVASAPMFEKEPERVKASLRWFSEQLEGSA